MKLSAWAVLLFMCFFTVLTFVLALTNPISDCGCFGDALILTNWETFFKNIILLTLALVVFAHRRKYASAFCPAVEWACVAVIAAVIIGISTYGYRHLPLLDFRPYSVGTDIPRSMTVPEDMPADEFKTTLFYEKDGVVKEFSENNYPWNDSTWLWKDTKSILVKQGYQPPIHDFSITMAENGADITSDVLNFEGYSFLLVAYRLDQSDCEALKKADKIAAFCKENGYGFYCLTSSLQAEIDALKAELGLSYDFCHTDGITLKTIIRANPGLLLLQNGTVLNKWHHNDMPDAKDLTPNLLAFSLQEQTATSDQRLIYLLLSLFVLAAYVFVAYRKK
jgi:hypothetical protein